MKKILLPVPALCVGVLLCLSLRGEAPSRLTTDLAEHTDRVWIGGYPSQVTLEQADKIVEPARFVTIGSRRPSFGWPGQRFAQRRNADRLPHPAGFVARNARNRLGRPVGQRRNSGRPQRSRPVCRQGTGARQNLLLESDDFQQRRSAAVVGRQGVPHGRFADRIRHAGLPARKNGQRLTENDPKTLRSARFLPTSVTTRSDSSG